MSFYIYQLTEPLILSNTSISLSAISHQSSAISYQLAYQLSAIFTKLVVLIRGMFRKKIINASSHLKKKSLYLRTNF